MVAEEIAADVRRGRRRERHGHERADAHLVHEHFDGEEHAADGRVERRGDSRAAARGHERGELPAGSAALARPAEEAKAAPIWMMGPSRPTEPPLPMEIADASDLTAATTGRMTPFL